MPSTVSGSAKHVVDDAMVVCANEKDDPRALATRQPPVVSLAELSKHSTADDLWVAISGTVSHSVASLWRRMCCTQCSIALVFALPARLVLSASVPQQVYNATKLVSKHPGGAAAVLSAAGRDATDVFTLRHPWMSSSAVRVVRAVRFVPCLQ